MTTLEEQQRAAVVAETLNWVGTEYHHEAEVKCIRDADGKIIDRGGVDCAKLLACVFHNVGLIPKLDIGHYPPDWHMHRDVERYLELVIPFAREITEEEAKPADVVMFKWGRTWAHGAIIIDPGWPVIVHALYSARQVLVDQGDQGRLSDRPRRFLSYWK